MAGKKRLCVFYKVAEQWIGKDVEWIVCKHCQRLIEKGVIEIPLPDCRGRYGQ